MAWVLITSPQGAAALSGTLESLGPLPRLDPRHRRCKAERRQPGVRMPASAAFAASISQTAALDSAVPSVGAAPPPRACCGLSAALAPGEADVPWPADADG